MSKLGRMPIALRGVTAEVKENNIVSIKGSNGVFSYELPLQFSCIIESEMLRIVPAEKKTMKRNERNAFWGMHRALINNVVLGAQALFEEQIIIDGLGFKVQRQGDVLVFSLGFSEKKTLTVPKGIVLDIDKTGQLITVKGVCKQAVGQFSAVIRALRPVEPYKQKGIRYVKEKVIRKEGKTK